MSDFWLIDGSYFRIKNITLGYSFKPVVFGKSGIQSLRLYVSANDIFSKHNFPKYWDPEATNASYPMVTTIMAGAAIRF